MTIALFTAGFVIFGNTYLQTHNVSLTLIKDQIQGFIAGTLLGQKINDAVVGVPIQVEGVSYDRYAYGQLDDETQAVYDQLYDCIVNYKEKATLSTLDQEVLSQAYDAIMADYGNLFWVSGYKYNTYMRGDKVISLEVEPSYTMTEEERDDYQEIIDETVEDWLSDIYYDDSDYDKALYVFETLINNVDYDVSADHNQDIISVFVNNATVCQGYADAAWYLLDQLGIKSTIVTGQANNDNHAWNLVYLDGAYYYMDVTWGNGSYLGLDDSRESRINHAYFAMTTEQLLKNHTITMDIDLPECLSTADNYYVKNGLYFDYLDTAAVGKILANSMNRGDSQISIMFSDAEIYSQVFKYFFEEKHIKDYCPALGTIYYILDDQANVITVHWQE